MGTDTKPRQPAPSETLIRLFFNQGVATFANDLGHQPWYSDPDDMFDRWLAEHDRRILEQAKERNQ